VIMAMWLHISAKNKTNVLQEGLHADSQDGAGFTKHWCRASHTALTQTSWVKGGTHSFDGLSLDPDFSVP